MYNEPQKLLYIDSYLQSSNVKDKESRRRNLCNFFNRIQEPEVVIDKDFAMFNYEEVKIALSMICRRSLRYQNSTISELRGYVEWCIDKGFSLDCENRLIGMSVNDIDIVASYRNNMFKNEADLNLALDKIMTPLHEDTSNNVLRAILHLLFNGILYKEVFGLRNSQVDFETNTIHLQDREVKFSMICGNILKYVMNMFEFFDAPKFELNNKPNMGFSYEASKFKVPVRSYAIFKNGYVIENTRENRTSMPLTYKPIITNAFATLKLINRDIISKTISDVVTSGIFSRIFEHEQKYGQPDFSEYFDIADQDNENEYCMVRSLCDVEPQYYRWKKAFGLADSE